MTQKIQQNIFFKVLIFLISRICSKIRFSFKALPYLKARPYFKSKKLNGSILIFCWGVLFHSSQLLAAQNPVEKFQDIIRIKYQALEERDTGKTELSKIKLKEGGSYYLPISRAKCGQLRISFSNVMKKQIKIATQNETGGGSGKQEESLLTFDDGRAILPLTDPLEVVLIKDKDGKDWFVTVDGNHDLLTSIAEGASSVPVRVIADYRSMDFDNVMNWGNKGGHYRLFYLLKKGGGPMENPFFPKPWELEDDPIRFYISELMLKIDAHINFLGLLTTEVRSMYSINIFSKLTVKGRRNHISTLKYIELLLADEVYKSLHDPSESDKERVELWKRILQLPFSLENLPLIALTISDIIQKRIQVNNLKLHYWNVHFRPIRSMDYGHFDGQNLQSLPNDEVEWFEQNRRQLQERVANTHELDSDPKSLKLKQMFQHVLDLEANPNNWPIISYALNFLLIPDYLRSQSGGSQADVEERGQITPLYHLWHNDLTRVWLSQAVHRITSSEHDQNQALWLNLGELHRHQLLNPQEALYPQETRGVGGEPLQERRCHLMISQ